MDGMMISFRNSHDIILNQAIASAARRGHSQTTPLHVAEMLFASPTGFFREACIKSHPNQAIQFRALELCITVALERLPWAQNRPGSDPPISNALMAALEWAQAHQRHSGCPEQQLILSILDDPDVSCAMMKAGFSIPAIKETIEQSMEVSNILKTSKL